MSMNESAIWMDGFRDAQAKSESELTRLREEIREKTEVLEWYADISNYNAVHAESNIRCDNGSRSCSVLQKFKPITKEREL